MDGPTKENVGELSLRLTLDELSGHNELPAESNTGGINLDPDTLRAIDVLGRSFTGSARRTTPEEEHALDKSRRRVQDRGLDIDLVTTYEIPHALEEKLVEQLRADGARYSRGPKGLEVYGPHNDRSVDVEALLRSGRIILEENDTFKIIEEIEVKKLY